MRKVPETDMLGNELFLAGELAPSGYYKQIDGSQIVELKHDDLLPACLDGRVTCYTRVPPSVIVKRPVL